MQELIAKFWAKEFTFTTKPHTFTIGMKPLLIVIFALTIFFSFGAEASAPNIPCYDVETGEMIRTAVPPYECERLGGTTEALPYVPAEEPGFFESVFGAIGDFFGGIFNWFTGLFH